MKNFSYYRILLSFYIVNCIPKIGSNSKNIIFAKLELSI